MIDDAVQIRCTRCKSTFREKARKLQSGYSRQCPNCEVLVFFEEASPDKNVQRALKDAKNVRRQLRLEEETKLVTRREPYNFGR